MRVDGYRRLSLILLLAFSTSPATGQASSDLENSIHTLAVQMADAMASGSVRKLAVVEFSDLNGYRSTLGPFITEELTTQLMVVKPGAFDIVERQQLAKVLEEQKLGATAILDAESIAKVGRSLASRSL
jgi:curli biogenesis system outer membrane secretion channel CsgG